MIRLEDGRNELFQWDVNRRLIIDDNTIDQVHYSNGIDDYSLVVETYEENGLLMADVPNILLQDKWDIKIYLYANGEYTKQYGAFKVIARAKPTDYVYTETEALKWDTLEAEIKAAAEANNEAIRAEVRTALTDVSNSLKGTVSGSGAVRINDISPLPHNIEVKTGVKTYGKNIFKYNYSDWKKKEGTQVYEIFLHLPLTTITISGKFKEGAETVAGYISVFKSKDNWATREQVVKNKQGIWVNGSIYDLTFDVESNYEYQFRTNATTHGVLMEEYLDDIQIEVGSKTEYEPYKEPVEGAVSIYPTTTLVADVAGTAIEATYNKDINKAFAELQNAMISLGANI